MNVFNKYFEIKFYKGVLFVYFVEKIFSLTVIAGPNYKCIFNITCKGIFCKRLNVFCFNFCRE